jgi:hypothetical protein
MRCIGFAALAIGTILIPAAYAADTSAADTPAPTTMPAAATTSPPHHVIHHRRSSAAPLAADERSLADAREHRETQAMNLIGAAGYSDFSDIKAVGKDFKATAVEKDGQRVSVLVDPDSGRVTPQ